LAGAPADVDLAGRRRHGRCSRAWRRRVRGRIGSGAAARRSRLRADGARHRRGRRRLVAGGRHRRRGHPLRGHEHGRTLGVGVAAGSGPCRVANVAASGPQRTRWASGHRLDGVVRRRAGPRPSRPRGPPAQPHGPSARGRGRVGLPVLSHPQGPAAQLVRRWAAPRAAGGVRCPGHLRDAAARGAGASAGAPAWAH
jgi:hypothetical protein